ncbi:MAG: site-specific DNA-methyltransferase [Anaeromassilibacillus sp.]
MTDKLDGLSMDIEAENKARLASVFPECFTEGRLDIDKLLSLCGEYITDDFEKYEFKWKGKSDCLRLAQRRSTATLRPCVAESVHFDTTQNLYIEGDNLEVLKLLQKSYFRKVKMIYIDPPYNTGNDFVYEDDFADPMRRYVEVTQQTTKSNPETMGRYHTNWLNMMYPRLRLAANLLRDDGVIFISIDDNEVANLRKLCDEVFGEENFLTQITWEKRFTRSNNARLFASLTDYILVYRKSEAVSLLRAPRTEKSDSIYNNPDNDPRGVWTSVSYVNPATKEQRPNLTYTIVNPITGQKINHPTNAWKYEYEKHLIHVAENRLYWGANGENTYPRLKKFLSEVEDGMVPVNLWKREDVGTTDAASKDLSMLMGQKVFDFPKPTDLIKTMIQIAANDKYSIILDFFSGSATTAHAVMQLNAEDGGNRRFILVQLPEVCDEKSEAYKAGYANICEIGKERIRRAGKKIIETLDGDKPPVDVGFKVFKLETSNMKVWDDTPIEGGDLATLFDRIDGHIDGLKPDRSDEDLIYEILLKMGYPLTADLTAVDVNGLTVYKVAEGEMIICLQPGITAEHIEQMAALAPQKVVLAGRGLADSSTKANAFYLLENRGIELKTV